MLNNNMQYHVISSPLGNLELIENNACLTHCHFTKKNISTDESPSLLLQEVEAQLKAYFGGKKPSFQFPLAPEGTRFQLNVWQALQQIPYGATWSYQQIATAVNNSKAVRAVGSANGKNPICIIIPCHRVIRASGELGGYTGGIDKKLFLLTLENP